MVGTLIQPALHQNLIVAIRSQLSSEEESFSFPGSLRVGVDVEQPLRRHKNEVRIRDILVIPMKMKPSRPGFSGGNRIIVAAINLPVDETDGLPFP